MLKNIILSKLFSIGAIKYGTFTLKSGEITDLYFDLRIMISYPNVYKLIYQYICYLYPTLFNDINLITGVNFGGIPLSSYISNEWNISQIYVRDTLKTYGTQKQIEGDYTLNKDLLIIEDVITTGLSTGEVLEVVKSKDAKIIGVGCIVDRSGKILDFGVKLKSLIKFDFPTYKPEECPLCEKGLEVTKPGSR